MNHRTRLLVAIASMLPLGLGVVLCSLLAVTGTTTTDMVSVVVIAVIVQGIFTYIRLRHTTPGHGRPSADDETA